MTLSIHQRPQKLTNNKKYYSKFINLFVGTLIRTTILTLIAPLGTLPAHGAAHNHNGAECLCAVFGSGCETKGAQAMPLKSPLMDELYGSNVADKVYKRLQDLDPELNEEIQRVAYDHFWSRPGLSTRDKSLVTVTSLIALGKEEQTRIHMHGFLNAGGTQSELVQILAHLGVLTGSSSASKGKHALLDVLRDRGIGSDQIEQAAQDLELLQRSNSYTSELSQRDKSLVNVASAVAIGNQEKTRAAIAQFLSDGETLTDLKNLMIHQIVYCGFPAAMNGFAALQEVALKKQ